MSNGRHKLTSLEGGGKRDQNSSTSLAMKPNDFNVTLTSIQQGTKINLHYAFLSCFVHFQTKTLCRDQVDLAINTHGFLRI